MTVFIPDISHHQAGIDIHALKRAGSGALIARVGQGAGRRGDGHQYGTTRDREWTRHRDEAHRVGLPLIAYWYVGNLITPDENARLANAWVGDSTIPWMIDHEDASGDGEVYCRTVAAFRARGLRVILGYVPNWYWAGSMNRSDLRCGPPIVNSRYSTRTGTPEAIYGAAGADNGAGWVNYGGQTTLLWQFTNKASMAGMAIDCSAYRGTYEQLREIINGTTTQGDEHMLLARQPSTGAYYIGDMITRRHLATAQDLADQKFIANKAQKPLFDLGDVENIATLGTDLTTAVANLSDDEANIIDAVRTIVEADANAEVAITPEQLAQLADAVVAAVPPHVQEAVRQAFARAGGIEEGTFALPDLTGMHIDQVQAALAAHSWNGHLVERHGAIDDPSRLNTVVDQSPQPRTAVTRSTEITIVIATEFLPGQVQ